MPLNGSQSHYLVSWGPCRQQPPCGWRHQYQPRAHYHFTPTHPGPQYGGNNALRMLSTITRPFCLVRPHMLTGRLASGDAASWFKTFLEGASKRLWRHFCLRTPWVNCSDVLPWDHVPLFKGSWLPFCSCTECHNWPPLTVCGLVTSYGVIELGQYWFR